MAPIRLRHQLLVVPLSLIALYVTTRNVRLVMFAPVEFAVLHNLEEVGCLLRLLSALTLVKNC